MDANLINPFISAIATVLPQLGFQSVKRKGLGMSEKKITLDGVIVNIGIVGEKIGNVVYNISTDTAKKIASVMMGGMPVTELDEMTKSAISEMSNILTANSSIGLSNMGYEVDISVPTMVYGDNIDVEMSKQNVIFVSFDIDGADLDIYISIE